MAISPRIVLRGFILGCVIAALGLLALATSRRGKEAVDTQIPSEFDTWAIRGLDYTHYAGDSPVLRITADEARLDRTQFGIFRIGFAHTLFVRNARVEIMIGTDLRSQESESSLHDRVQALGRSGGSLVPHNAVTGLRAEGIALHLKNPGGRWVEISAERCRAGPLSAGRVTFHGHVRVRGEELDRTFARLDYDVQSRRFAAGRHAPARGTSPTNVVDVTSLEEVNAAIWHVGDINWQALKFDLMQVFAAPLARESGAPADSSV